MPDVNIATPKYKAKTIEGQNPNVLLDGNITKYSGYDGNLMFLNRQCD